MTNNSKNRGSAIVGRLDALPFWEANLIQNLRLWCEGSTGQDAVWSSYERMLNGEEARQACCCFDTLINTIVRHASRRLMRREVGCICFNADESVLLHLIRCATDGDLQDAAVMAALLVGPTQAQRVALIASQVGTRARDVLDQPIATSGRFGFKTVQLH